MSDMTTVHLARAGSTDEAVGDDDRSRSKDELVGLIGVVIAVIGLFMALGISRFLSKYLCRLKKSRQQVNANTREIVRMPQDDPYLKWVGGDLLVHSLDAIEEEGASSGSIRPEDSVSDEAENSITYSTGSVSSNSRRCSPNLAQVPSQLSVINEQKSPLPGAKKPELLQPRNTSSRHPYPRVGSSRSAMMLGMTSDDGEFADIPAQSHDHLQRVFGNFGGGQKSTTNTDSCSGASNTSQNSNFSKLSRVGLNTKSPAEAHQSQRFKETRNSNNITFGNDVIVLYMKSSSELLLQAQVNAEQNKSLDQPIIPSSEGYRTWNQNRYATHDRIKSITPAELKSGKCQNDISRTTAQEVELVSQKLTLTKSGKPALKIKHENANPRPKHVSISITSSSDVSSSQSQI